jgi:hypothetical protein
VVLEVDILQEDLVVLEVDILQEDLVETEVDILQEDLVVPEVDILPEDLVEPEVDILLEDPEASEVDILLEDRVGLVAGIPAVEANQVTPDIKIVCSVTGPYLLTLKQCSMSYTERKYIIIPPRIRNIYN